MNKIVDYSMKILLAEDTSSQAQDFIYKLGLIGFNNIIWKPNGYSAFEELKKEDSNFQFIISDYQMPKMSGKDLYLSTRRLEKYKNTPFLLWSLAPIERLELGSEDLHFIKMRKAIDPGEISQVIRELLQMA